VRKQLNLNKQQLNVLIAKAVQNDILEVYGETKSHQLYKINHNIIPLCRKETPNEVATVKLKQHLRGKQTLKNLSVVATQIGVSYRVVTRAVKQLEKEGVLVLSSKASNNHRVYHVCHL
jgi:DNA-binding MarR family transcriptional regulator